MVKKNIRKLVYPNIGYKLLLIFFTLVSGAEIIQYFSAGKSGIWPRFLIRIQNAEEQNF